MGHSRDEKILQLYTILVVPWAEIYVLEVFESSKVHCPGDKNLCMRSQWLLFDSLFSSFTAINDVVHSLKKNVRYHVNFQNLFDFSQAVKAKCHFNMYLSYALQQWSKVILTEAEQLT